MGKQKGQSQRTKGNIRPSSSGRAANFLSSDNLVGFECLAGDLGYIPILKSLEDDTESLIDPHFKVALCKLSKRDVTTKLKALSEFSELCESSDVNATISVLPYWPRLYNKLSADIDRRVREAVENALQSLVSAVGKAIAPHLRSIIGAWWIARCDSYAPAASSAINAFLKAFPSEEKQKKAIVFGQEQILDAVFTGMFATAKATTSGGDDRDMYREVASSIGALASFLQAIKSEETTLKTELLCKILDNPKFWKFAKHKSAAIRSAYYCVLSALCTTTPELLEAHKQIALKSVLCKLNESDPLICKAVWEAADKLTATCSDWHEHVDLRKGFLPQVWGILKSGFHGNAHFTCPYLLPLVSRFPATLAVIPVYQEFFACLQTGMEMDSMVKSASETRAVVTATVECMQYILRKSVETCEVPDWEIANHVLKSQLFPLLTRSVQKSNFHSYLISPLHQLIATTMGTLAEKAAISPRPENLLSVCALIWSHILHLGCALIDDVGNTENSDSCLSVKLEPYVNFLKAIKTVCYGKQNTGKSDESKIASSSSMQAIVANTTLLDSFENCLTDWIKYCVTAVKLNSLQTLELVTLVLSNFTTAKLLEKVGEGLNLSESPQDPCNYAGVVLNSFLFPCFQACTTEQASNLPTNVPAAFFSCIRWCDACQASDFLNNFYSASSNAKLCTKLGQLLVDNAEIPTKTPYVKWLMQEQCPLIDFFIYLLKTSSQNQDIAFTTEWKWVHSALNKQLTFGAENASAPLLLANQALLLLESIREQIATEDCSSSSVLAFTHLVMDVVKNYQDDADFIATVDDCLTFALKKLMQRSLANSDHTANIVEVLNKLLQTPVSHEKYLLSISNGIQNFLLCHSQTASIADLVSDVMLVFSERNVSEPFVQDWLSALIPDEKVFGDWHPSIDSNCWITLDSILGGECLTFNLEVETSVPDIPSQHSDASYTILNAIMFGIEAFPVTVQITRLPKFQKLFIESVFLNTVGSGNHELLDLHRHFMQQRDFASVLCKMVFENCVTTGGGWYQCLTYLLEISDPNITTFFLELLESRLTQDITLTPELATTINLQAKKMSKGAKCLSIKKWLLEVALENELTYLQDVEKNCSMALAITCLATVLKSQESQSQDVTFSILQLIVQWKASYPDSFLFDCDLVEYTNKQVFYNTAIARFLEFTVSSNVSAIHNDMWDFYQCSTVSWLESISSSCETSPGTHTFILLQTTCQLMHALSTFLASRTAIEDPTLPSTLTNEWKQFFEPAAHVNLCTIFMLLNSSNVYIHDKNIHSMFACLSTVSIDSLLSAAGRVKPYLYPGSNLPDPIQTLLYHLCTAFRNPDEHSGPVQALAFRLLNNVIQQMFVDKNASEIIDFKVPDSFQDVLRKSSNSTLSLLAVIRNQHTQKHPVTRTSEEDSEEEAQDHEEEPAVEKPFPLLDMCEVLSLSAYLLTWRLTVKSTNYVKADCRSDYITSMNRDSITNLDTLLTNLWYLLPDVPLIHVEPGADKKANKINLFETEPVFTNTEFDFNLIQHLSCLLYKDILSSMPVLIRTWYNNLSKLNRANVDSYTSRYVSPVICKAELQTVSLSKHQKDIAVRARLATREVVARYEVSDADFEITVQLAANHPLSPVQVNTVKRVGVAASQWRYWILQMTMLLQHQNGSIIDALLLWKQKVDKRLDGLEECMICFSVVHGSNAQSLPKLECKTCHKKYHAECLYKWFDTSNQSTCPLCRAPMMFR